jgi:hypothetical protein
MIKLAKNASDTAKMTTPPAACASYHTRLIELLDESTHILETLRDAIKRSDTNALVSIGSTATALKSKADALGRDATAIKARYGIK